MLLENGTVVKETQFITVTPEQAQKWLTDCNEQQGHLIPARVKTYATDMSAGRWDPNGEPLIFSKENKLLNGQNRLHACVQANVPFTTSIVIGRESSTYRTIDTGKGRSNADVLSIKGIKNPSAVTAVLTLISKYEKDKVGFTKDKETAYEIDECLLAHPGVEDVVAEVAKLPKGLKDAAISFMIYASTVAAPELTKSILEKLGTGANLKKDDPILTLRNKFMFNKDSDRTVNLALVIKTLNAEIAGKQISVLKYNRKTETFPAVKGLLIGKPIVEKKKDSKESEVSG